MANKKTVRRNHSNLRLVKNNDVPSGKKRTVGKENYRNEKLRFGRRKRLLIAGGLFASVVLVMLFSYEYIMRNYTVTTVFVEGNIHYTNEEIMNMVMDGKYGNNSLFLSFKYRDKGMEGIPFIQKMDVSIESKDTIRITVYEKALAGYVTYLGRYVYFDNEGTVVETSEEKTQGVPQVTGLIFDHVILHEPLPVDNPDVFDDVLNITQQLSKYNLSVDKIYFDKDYQVTLLFGDARIALGDSGDVDEKIMKLQYILPELEGKSGLLDMRDYNEDTKTYSFEQD